MVIAYFCPCAELFAGRHAGNGEEVYIPDQHSIAEESGLELPQSIAELPSLEVRHKDVIEKEQMMSMVRKILLG